MLSDTIVTILSPMKKEGENGQAAPGVAEPKEVPTITEVKKWVKDDCARCIAFLNAIHSDPDLVDHVANFMLGRLTNAKAKDVDAAQTKLDV